MLPLYWSLIYKFKHSCHIHIVYSNQESSLMKRLCFGNKGICILNCLRGKQKRKRVWFKHLSDNQPPPLQNKSLQPCHLASRLNLLLVCCRISWKINVRGVLVEFDHHREDSLGVCDGLALRIPCFSCSQNKSPTQTNESRVIFTS